MAETKTQDALALLKEDHRKVEKLFKDYEGAKGDGRKEKLARQICFELTVHTTIEEEIFYPALRKAGNHKDDDKMYFEALEEHRAAGDLVLPDLLKTEPASEKFSGRAKVLKELTEHHVEEEETEMFKRAKALLDKATLEQLGEQLAQRKAELKKQAGKA